MFQTGGSLLPAVVPTSVLPRYHRELTLTPFPCLHPSSGTDSDRNFVRTSNDVFTHSSTLSAHGVISLLHASDTVYSWLTMHSFRHSFPSPSIHQITVSCCLLLAPATYIRHPRLSLIKNCTHIESYRPSFVSLRLCSHSRSIFSLLPSDPSFVRVFRHYKTPYSTLCPYFKHFIHIVPCSPFPQLSPYSSSTFYQRMQISIRCIMINLYHFLLIVRPSTHNLPINFRQVLLSIHSPSPYLWRSYSHLWEPLPGISAWVIHRPLRSQLELAFYKYICASCHVDDHLDNGASSHWSSAWGCEATTYRE